MEKKVMVSDLISLVNANNLAFRNNFESLAQDILRVMHDAIAHSEIGAFYGYQYVGYYIDEIIFDSAGTPTAKINFRSPVVFNDIPESLTPYSDCKLSETSKSLCDIAKIQLDYPVSLLENAGVECYCYNGRVLILLDVGSEATDDAE